MLFSVHVADGDFVVRSRTGADAQNFAEIPALHGFIERDANGTIPSPSTELPYRTALNAAERLQPVGGGG